ncbi:hypothetical protein Tco_0792034 [Tanacetum coccineum]
MLAVSGLREEYNSLKTTIPARQSPTAFSKLHALFSDHDYMLGKTRAPAPSITSSFAANYAGRDEKKILDHLKQDLSLESVSIRRIQGIGYGVLEFLGVGTTFDIFQNILFTYSLNTAYYLSWIRRIGLVSFVVFGECRHGYAISSLMDMAYWLLEQ